MVWLYSAAQLTTCGDLVNIIITTSCESVVSKVGQAEG